MERALIIVSKQFLLNINCYVFHIHKQEQELKTKTENGILESIKKCNLKRE